MPDKFMREIEEILKQAEAKPQPERPRQRRPARASFSFKGWSISPGRVMLIGVVLVVAALLLMASTPWKAQPLLWAGVGLLLVAYILLVLKPGARAAGMEKRWRGRPVEDARPSPWSRVKRWFGKK